MKLKWSRYNIFVNMENTENVRIFNSVSRGIYDINKYTLECIVNYFNSGELIDDKLKQIISKLYYEKFIVNYEFDEVKYFNQYRKQYYNSVFGVVIYLLSTMNCNFKCPYCIVSKVDHGVTKEVKKISGETIDQSVRWIVNFLNENEEKIKKSLSLNPNADKLSVTLFGGEPTLAHEKNIEFLEKLKKSIPKWVRLSSDIITNGYILNNEMIKDLKNHNLQSVQITLDGPEKIHNQRRITSDNKPTFYKIIDNCKEVIKENVRLAIRVNIDEENVDHIHELIDELVRLDFNKKVILNIAPVDKYVGCDNLAGHKTSVMSKFGEIYRYAKSKGFKFGGWETFCGVYANSFFALSPSGELYKCPSLVGDGNEVVGNVNCNQFKPLYYEIINNEIDEDCAKCCWAGVCGGGCYNQISLNKKNGNKKICQKSTFDLVYKEYIINGF